MNSYVKGLLVAALTAPLLAASSAAHAEGPEAYCFAKRAIAPGSWIGTYAPVAADGSCDPTNGLRMVSQLTSAPVVTGEVAHITIRWQFFDQSGALAFQTDQSGILKLGSGDVVLNGTVTGGENSGARTHDEGTPTDANGSYAGVMRVQS